MIKSLRKLAQTQLERFCKMGFVYTEEKVKFVIDELKKYVEGEEEDPFFALELANSLYGEHIKGITEAYDTAIAFTKTAKRYSKVIINILEEFLDTNKLVGFDLSNLNIDDNELVNLILDSAKLFNQNDYKAACYNIWGALERIKTFNYTDEDIRHDKRKSSDELLNSISQGNEGLKILYENELKELTKIGNTYKIRHHEKNQVVLECDKYYKYFYLRCLSFLEICIFVLYGEKTDEI